MAGHDEMMENEWWKNRLREVDIRLKGKPGLLKSNAWRAAAYYRQHGLLRTVYRIQAELKRRPVRDIELKDCLKLFKENPGIPPLEEPVDIIIPVYNGMPYLVRLFDSLFRNTTPPYRLIIVDDASTDSRILPFLQKIAGEHPNVLLIHSPENKGFVWSVNLASRHVRNHFVLLNTDVEVPGRWLERLMSPIFRNPRIASVTPFTNAGSICSFPIMNVDNELFDHRDVDCVDGFFRYIDHDSVRSVLPTGVGFCMGINLKAWREVGALNYDLFGLGYGEENDWCIRAGKAGYFHVIRADLFVYHKHGASFGARKAAIQERNLKILFEKNPRYLQRLHEFYRSDPVAPARQMVLLLLGALGAPSGTVLVIDHAAGGGANVYRRKLVTERLNRGWAVLLLTEDLTGKKIKLNFQYKTFSVNFAVSDLEEIFSLFARIPCREIFYNNLVSWHQPLDILKLVSRIIKEYKARLTIALHDYFSICPSYTLIDRKGVFCNLPGLPVCRRCLPANRYSGVPDGRNRDIDVWREAWGEIFSIADRVVCFSESSKSILERVYSLDETRIAVEPHDLPRQIETKPRVSMDSPLNIGVVGAVSYPKGAGMVARIARLLRQRAPAARVTVIGTIDGAFRSGNFTVTGPYQPADLPGLIEKYRVNVCLFPSLWPETFSYVCSELMEMEMPLCSFDLGAQGERVARYRFGHIISEMDAGKALEEIIRFHAGLKDRAAAAAR